MSTMDNTPAEDPTKERRVTMTFTLAQEALDSLLDPGLKPVNGTGGKIRLLAIALATICMELRDAQNADLPEGMPNARRRAELKIAGREAAVAITHIELALGMALKAAARVG